MLDSKKYIFFKDGKPSITNLYETTMFYNIKSSRGRQKSTLTGNTISYCDDGKL